VSVPYPDPWSSLGGGARVGREVASVATLSRTAHSACMYIVRVHVGSAPRQLGPPWTAGPFWLKLAGRAPSRNCPTGPETSKGGGAWRPAEPPSPPLAPRRPSKRPEAAPWFGLLLCCWFGLAGWSVACCPAAQAGSWVGSCRGRCLPARLVGGSRGVVVGGRSAVYPGRPIVCC